MSAVFAQRGREWLQTQAVEYDVWGYDAGVPGGAAENETQPAGNHVNGTTADALDD